MTKANNVNWRSFLNETFIQARIYLFLVAISFIFRILMIAWFPGKISSGTTFSEVVLTLAHGFRFDSKLAAVVLLIPFLLNGVLVLFGHFKFQVLIRKIFVTASIPIILLSMIATVPYFREYDSQFNFFMFEIIYDDQTAVLKTVFQEYGLIQNLFLLVLLSYMSIRVITILEKSRTSRMMDRLVNVNSIIPRVIIIFILLVLTLGAIRGSFRDRPAMRKWSDITSDEFLNKMVMNPLNHLHYAYRDYHSIYSGKLALEHYLGKTKPYDAAVSYFGAREDELPVLSNFLKKNVQTGSDSKPDHIFLLVMESYDIWPLLPEYGSLGIAEGLKELGNNGVLFSRILPSGKSTMASLSTILTGVPYMGRNISRISSSGPPYSTSISNTIEPLGYKTRLFYGGFSSWQNIGNMFKGQGFDEIYASPQMEKDEEDQVWGVQDETLFNYTLRQIPQNEKTFNLIMTTTYHPPFNVDVKAKGFDLEEIPENIKPVFDGSMDLNQLGHIWYMDMELKKFVRSVEAKFPNSLFIITGDHFGRRFINARPSIYEKSVVPLVFYGPQFVKKAPTWVETPGSHADLIPTILEVMAPKGYEYFSFGEPLFNKDREYGIGYKTIIETNNVYKVNSDSRPNYYNEFLGLAWWYVFEGDSLSN